jgi:hypothetical protein
MMKASDEDASRELVGTEAQHDDSITIYEFFGMADHLYIPTDALGSLTPGEV